MTKNKWNVTRQLVLSGAAFVAGAMMTAGFAVNAQPDTGEGMDPEMQAMMEAWAKVATPGPHHEILDKLVGEFTTTTKMWMTPGAPPDVSHGSSKSELILGGRYVAMDFKGTMMGEPFYGRDIFGYDNVKQKYHGAWADTAGTGLYMYSGTMNEAGDTITTFGEYPSFTGEGITKMKSVSAFSDDGSVTFSMYFKEPGMPEWMQNMEIVYTRK